MTTGRSTLAWMGAGLALAGCLMFLPATTAHAATEFSGHGQNTLIDGKDNDGNAYSYDTKQSWAQPDLIDDVNHQPIPNFTETNLTITKVVIGNQALDTNGDTFTFSFYPNVERIPTEPTITPSTTTGQPNGQMINIAPVTIQFDAMGTSDTQTKVATVPMPAASVFPHAGVYGYTVKETGHSVKEGADWVWSEAVYDIRVYIKNENGTLKYDYITTESTKKDDGTSNNHKEPIRFVNTYVGKRDLTLTKMVEGDYADMTKPFNIIVNLTLPETADQNSTYNYTFTPEGGVTQTRTVAFSNGKATIGSESFKNGDTLVIKQLPVGTHYNASEAPTSNMTDAAHTAYHNKWTYQFSGEAGQTSAGFMTKQNGTVVDSTTFYTSVTSKKQNSIAYALSEDELRNPTSGVPNPNTRTMVGCGVDNRFAVTNTAEDTPATGFVVTNLPYVVLIGLPVAFGIAYVVVRRKAASNE